MTIGTSNQLEFNYANRPILEEIPVKKQRAKRHFGVHGYFTRQSWNVVAEYIVHFSKPGDLILDPFGGSGTTAIEALMNGRKAIHVDLNPMSVFMVKSLTAPVNEIEFIDAYQRVKRKYLKGEPKSKTEIGHAILKYPYPKGFPLPKDSDVNTIEKLFTHRQLAQLAFLKSLIKEEKNEHIQNSLLLAFSSSLNKFNKMFHYTKTEGGGDSAPFRYYRYRLAPEPAHLDLMDIFETKFKKQLAAKREMQPTIDAFTFQHTQIVKGSATDLYWIAGESVDYIYTDPPYGKKIPYLDLSAMWNGWLDLEVTKPDYEQEAIEGGDQKKTKNEYNSLISASIKEMYRVLKFDRWMSFVFAHKDPGFWQVIMDSAENCGFEYIGAVSQKNGQTSFKKRQHPFNALSGQLIINFKKLPKAKRIVKANLGSSIAETVRQTIEHVINRNKGATLEQINDELIIKGLEQGFLHLLKKQYADLTRYLFSEFEFVDSSHRFFIRSENGHKTAIG